MKVEIDNHSIKVIGRGRVAMLFVLIMFATFVYALFVQYLSIKNGSPIGIILGLAITGLGAIAFSTEVVSYFNLQERKLIYTVKKLLGERTTILDFT